MLSSFKSELRKILSIRSTYIILLFAVAMNLLFAFYVTGWHTAPEALADPKFLSVQVISAISALGLFGGLVAILLVTHEYRYNTIVFTLTANKSRSQVFLSKLLTITLFAVVFTAVFGALSPLLSLLAIHIRGLDMGHQTIQVWHLVWHSLLAGIAYVVYAFIIAMIIRVQVGAIAAIFLIPATIEPLLGLVLKKNVAYLPFNALNMSLGTGPPDAMAISDNRAALVVVTYMVVGLLVAWVLFLRRDAN
ncbi:MAG TPA: ABC transporter permease [Verrucomicrobiae bacterium]|nr:ABC transporter permease [Verrucomicrobiae bacterium]